MEQPLSSKNETVQSERSSGPDEPVEIVVVGDGDPYKLGSSTPPSGPTEPAIIVSDDGRGEPFRLVDLKVAETRASLAPWLLALVALTIVLGFGGVIALNILGKPADVIRELTQTALAAEIAILASALARPS